MRRARAGGFTLVEVLVALVVMSVMAGLAWRGIDGLARAREATQFNFEATERLNTVLAQWQADLEALYETPGVPALSFDGATLRLTRATEDGVQLVAWQLRGQRWLRWASPVVQRFGDLQEHWMRSQQLLGNEPNQLLLLEGVNGIQVYFYRRNGWSNAQSSADVVNLDPNSAAGGQQRVELPTGVRLVLTVTRPRPGTITRSIALGPQATS
ncbi:prepilin-type N-terminal cleavage/methylation domain-containing protein [Azohydromonas caseinilytica]|uniref:Prepilin-type N-terminal cleavage/methylation domain-containing protein n=1 Tax=Azohydromonas caseinilytica TaxID=2728836 RepID=A0A848F4C4_9BURK|nr:prepilin-type N-terminal cleavage/methylation domain-containing protein [Azohydromonas caseinilytica]NML13469.1 prepilin-type N-terminal cleavage/methylation domain-containing protein [Azohydromonas caseinilytica]